MDRLILYEEGPWMKEILEDGVLPSDADGVCDSRDVVPLTATQEKIACFFCNVSYSENYLKICVSMLNLLKKNVKKKIKMYQCR